MADTQTDAKEQLFNLLRQLSEVQNAGSSGASSSVPPDIQQSTPAPAPEPEPNQPDPTTITTYKDALKHVVFYTSRNQAVMDEVKVLIDDQFRHEKQWFKSRQELEYKQEQREKSQKELNSVFEMVVGSSSTANSSATSKEDKLRELQNHDLKVYRYFVELAGRQHQVLADLGIPLFCIRRDIQRPVTLAGDRKRLLEFFQDLLH